MEAQGGLEVFVYSGDTAARCAPPASFPLAHVSPATSHPPRLARHVSRLRSVVTNMRSAHERQSASGEFSRMCDVGRDEVDGRALPGFKDSDWNFRACQRRAKREPVAVRLSLRLSLRLT